MMTIIKQGIITLLVSFAVLFFMPLVSFADVSGVIDDFEFSLNNDYNFQSGFLTVHYGGDSPYNDTYYYDFSTENRFCVGIYLMENRSGARIFTLNSFDYTFKHNNSSSEIGVFTPRKFGSDTLYISAGEGSSGGASRIGVSSSLGCPVFYYNSDDFNYSAILNYLKTGDTSAALQNSLNEVASPSSLGYIKPSYYLDNHVGSSGDYEIITWASTSTTGVDLTDSRYNVQFALRDKSYTMSAGEKAKINFDTYPNMVEGIGTYLGRKIYNFSHDNVNNAILRGDAVPMSTYNNMVSLGITSASSRRFAFNAMNEYSNSANFQAAHPEIAANLNNVINANIQEFIPGGFLQRIFNDSNLRNLADFQLSYDIYARITDSQSGTKGNWLLIDKHGRPVKDLENVLNGGSTIRPVKVPDFEPTSDFTTAPDDEDIPDEELDDNDTVKDEPLPTGYIDPSSGDGVNNYYNYTYNYDNRTWIENHYDNQTVEEVNEGLEWIKMFPGFFGLFLKFFGAFLPGWAVVCVTIAIPIIIGLLIFKAIKGVIPFV